MSLKATILAAAGGAAPELVPVPEWGCDVHVREMTGAERDAYEAETYQVSGKTVELNRQNARARLLVRCLSDEQGKRIFGDDDADVLGTKSGAVLDRLYVIAQRVNKLTAKDLEDAAKN
jgi:hypothetical protein